MAPVQNSSILTYLVLRESLTQANMSCLERFSVLALVAYTFTAIVPLTFICKRERDHSFMRVSMLI